ncbi:hypothetical protein [Lentzea sp. E54]|uniref:hypothetical protein n=1 Tax=Lentzea xerophila TaxID=3435883 RepID=UPI003DA59D8E
MGGDLFRGRPSSVPELSGTGVHPLVINGTGVLFDGGPDDGVSEGQLRSGAEDADPHQHVRARDHFGQFQSGCRGGQFGFCLTECGDHTGQRHERHPLFAQPREHRRRDLPGPEGAHLRCRSAGRRDVQCHKLADQLVQQEGIASRRRPAGRDELLADLAGERVADQSRAVARAEAAQRHAPQRSGHLGQQLRMSRLGARAPRHHHRDPDRTGPPQQIRQPAQRRRVGLLDVVHGDEHRLTPRKCGHQPVQRVQCRVRVQ